ncbi:MAG: hypothetical protein HS100_13085 [Anaerolineales bacterium]|nr:hypothetical protein [Anaerolineales bacterium]
MKRNMVRMILGLFFAAVAASCTTSDLIRPSNKIGPMWIQRYGHTNATPIWDFCELPDMATPGVFTTECTIPEVDELFIGVGICAADEDQREAIWQARTWEMYIDGHGVDLPAFNIADSSYEDQQCRVWRIRLREIPEGEHAIRYVMHVNEQVEGDPDPDPLGTYELIVNFTQKK